MALVNSDQGIRQFPTGTLARDIISFIVDRRAANLSPGTIGFYRNKLDYLAQYAVRAGLSDTEQVMPAHLRELLADLAQSHRPGGVHAIFRALRTFFRWWSDETGRANPMAKLRAPRLPLEPLEPVSLATVRAMLATCMPRALESDRDRAILLFLIDTGLRATELVSLRVGDVDAETGAVVVRCGKGRKHRVVFVGNRCLRELGRYLRHRHLKAEDPLFATQDGRPLTYWGLRQIIRRRAARAGVPVPSLHSFRRAFALGALRGGMNIYALQRLMGHADLTMLQRYLAQTNADLASAHAQAGPVDHALR